MVLHLFIILFQLAVLAAFLILWYFWVKRKLHVTFGLDNEEHILFPFKYFSWLVLGLILLCGLVQIHYMRSAASLQQQLAAAVANRPATQSYEPALAEIQRAVVRLRSEMEEGFNSLQNQQTTDLTMPILPREITPTIAVPTPTPAPGFKKSVSRKRPLTRNRVASFAHEAKASSASSINKRGKNKKAVSGKKRRAKVHTMRLSMMGRVKADSLIVRSMPAKGSKPIDRLPSGKEVKVTEKRIAGERMWYRIITPSGRAGWVDHRYLKLEEAKQEADAA